MNEEQKPDPRQQIDSLRQQLCEAFIARQDADEKIKAIRNVLAGIPIGQALAASPVSAGDGP